LALKTQDSRVNVLLRLVGLVFLGLGAAMTYLTYSEADLAPQIVPVFYLVSIMLMIVGIIVAVAKFK
jgi:hypothetical protein